MRWLRVALVPAGLVLGIAAEWVSYGAEELDTAVEILSSAGRYWDVGWWRGSVAGGAWSDR